MHATDFLFLTSLRRTSDHDSLLAAKSLAPGSRLCLQTKLKPPLS